MPLIVNQIRLNLDEGEEELLQRAAGRLAFTPDDIANLNIIRQSIDARDKGDVHFSYTLSLRLKRPVFEEKTAAKAGVVYEPEKTQSEIPMGSVPLANRPVIAGAGPAGLFCAYLLSAYGFSPLVIERGKSVEERQRDYERLCRDGHLDPESNVCFGEGGAGAFSDGKLTTRIKDARAAIVLDLLIKAGAPENIRYAAKPHMGTENIRAAVKALRAMAIENGATFLFGTKLTDYSSADGQIGSITWTKDGTINKEAATVLVLATGHSARDTYALLKEKGAALKKKPFAMGLRIEHPREMIDRSQYGDFYAHPKLGAADYRLTSRFNDRGVYTFCMCPGGLVIDSSSEPGYTAVNGMSYYARDMQNSNSAVVVTVGAEDLPEGDLAGVEFQRRWESAAFSLAGGSGAPVQRLKDFIDGRVTKSFGAVQPTVAPRAVPADLNTCLPGFVSAGIKRGTSDFARRLKGFDMPDAVLTGVETRTSAPLFILRDENCEAIGLKGLYPAGEGGGHAGGIVSAAVDGLKVAEAIIRKYKPCY